MHPVHCHQLFLTLTYFSHSFEPASVAHLDVHPTDDQEVAGRTPPGPFVEIDHEIFLRPSSPLRLIKKGSCQFLAKECTQVLVNGLQDYTYSGKLTALDITLMGWLGGKSSTQTNKHTCLNSTALVAQVRYMSHLWSGGHKFDPHWIQQNSFVEIDH